MDQSSTPKVEGAMSDTPSAYALTAYQPVVTVSGAPPAGVVFPSGSQGVSVYPVMPAQLSDQNQIAFQQVQQLHHQQQQQQVQAFWADQRAEIEQMSDFKLHNLPLARIKKIVKADEDVQMIAGEAPAVFAKACEMFIMELTMKAWLHAEQNKRKTLQKNDIAAVVARTDIFDFLLDIMPTDELKEDGVGLSSMASPYVPGMAIPFGIYANQQPVAFAWPKPENTSDGVQDERMDRGHVARGEMLDMPEGVRLTA